MVVLTKNFDSYAIYYYDHGQDYEAQIKRYTFIKWIVEVSTKSYWFGSFLPPDSHNLSTVMTLFLKRDIMNT